MTVFSIMMALDPKRPISNVIQIAQAAEALGLDKLWLYDAWSSKDGYIGLALAAQHTKTLGLGIGVAPTPLRNAALLVNTIASVDDVSQGRAILGIGSGGQATCGRLGVPKARISEFREEMKLIHQLLDGAEVTRGSQRYSIESVERKIPLYTAVWGPRMQEVSGELADGVIIMGPERPEIIEMKAERIRAAAAAAGRAPGSVKIVAQVTCAYADAPTELIEQHKTLALHCMQRMGYEGEYAMEYRPLFDKIRENVALIAMPHGESPGTENVPDQFVKDTILVGTEAECVQRLRAILALEPDEVTFTGGNGQVSDVEKVANLFTKALSP